MKYYLKLLAVPLFLSILFLTLSIGWEVFNLPPPDEAILLFEKLFDLYGLPILFLNSIVESMLLVGGYFPGTFVIFIGIVLADTALEAVIVIAVAIAGLFIGHIGNYLLGRYGWYRLFLKFGLKGAIEDAKERLTERGPIAILGSYFLSSLAAMVDTAAGILHMPFKRFLLYSLGSTAFWGILVGTAVYMMGETALEVVAPRGNDVFFVFALLIVWIAVLLLIDYRKKNRVSMRGE